MEIGGSSEVLIVAVLFIIATGGIFAWLAFSQKKAANSQDVKED